MSASPLRHRGGKTRGLPRFQPFNIPKKSKPWRFMAITIQKRVRKIVTHKHVLVAITVAAYAAAIAGAFLVGKILGNYINSTDYDVVIVGAGWAGLAAAQTLLDAGVSSVLVLEANGYVGGRSKSINTHGPINSPDAVGAVDNLPTEIGAEWLYVGTDMAEALHARNLTRLVWANTGTKRYSINFYSAAYYNQSLIDGRVETHLVKNITSQQVREWDRFLRENSLQNHTHTALSYAEQMRSYKRRHNSSSHDARYLRLMESIIEIEYGGDSSQVSSDQSIVLRGHTHYTSIAGLGFGNLAGRFAAPLASYIRLNARVVKVERSDGPKSSVTYVRDGATRTVSARAVLVTLPLGVLKAGTVRFDPALPAWKADLIDNMGFGILNKCIMYWNHPEDVVWPKDRFWLELMTADNAIADQWTTFFNPTSFKHVPMLVGFIAGQAAVDAEAQTDAEILSRVMRSLRAMYPAIRTPDRVIVTRWGRDANARGSYAFAQVGRNWKEDSVSLGRRIGQLWFAGEATYTTPGTTYAAWNTGVEAGRRMADDVRSWW